MNAELNVRRHSEVDKTIRLLPQYIVDSFEVFEYQLRCKSDLLTYTKTQPFSPRDAVGNRTLIAHYHLPPCQPVCYLIGLVRTDDTAYVLDIFEHPPKGTFASRDIEERLYSRLSDVCPEFSQYRLPGSYRSGLPINNKDLYGATRVKGIPFLAPVRASNADYLPLGQLAELREGRSRVGIVMGTFDIPREEIQDKAIECIDFEGHPDRESLTLYRGGWASHSGILRKETDQIIFWFCPLHHVVIRVGSRIKPVVLALSQQEYQRLVSGLRAEYQSVDGKEQEMGELVDRLIEHFPLYRA